MQDVKIISDKQQEFMGGDYCSSTTMQSQRLLIMKLRGSDLPNNFIKLSLTRRAVACFSNCAPVYRGPPNEQLQQEQTLPGVPAVEGSELATVQFEEVSILLNESNEVVLHL